MIPLIVGAVLLGGGGWFFWDDIQRAWKGKKIVILGHAGSGKTSFYHYLMHQEVKTGFSATIGKDKVKQKKPVEISGLKIYMKNCHDIGGKESYHEDWRAELKGADYIFFLYNMHDLFFRGDIKTRAIVYAELSKAADAIAELVKEQKTSSLKFCMVGTHADLLPSERVDKLLNHPQLREISHKFGGCGKFSQHSVALNKAESIKDLLKAVIRE